jgi:alcohol dehydrogenase
MIDYQLRTRLVAGQRAIERLGELARELGGHRVLIVSDPGVVAAGIYQIGADQIRDAGLESLGFHQLTENPTTEHVQAGVQIAEEFRPDLLIGLGGGSSMDCAKGINFIYSCGGKISDYWGVGKATAPMLPMIAVPTTAGTGSETQSFALISDAHTHVKMACGDPKASAAVAILDPLLTCSQPPSVTALTGIDALTHALETFVTTKRNAMSDCYAREAWMLLSRGFPRVIDEPSDLHGRSQMQLGAAFAGMAIEASMLGAAHALANPLTAYLNVPHGQAVGMMMPHVIRFNASCVESRYRELVHLLPELAPSDHCIASEILADRFTRWLQIASMSTGLEQLATWPAPSGIASGSSAGEPSDGAAEDLLESMAQMAAKQWTGAFNPRPAQAEDFLAIYRAARSA